MNHKLITIALLFFLILCLAAMWGKVKEWFLSISTTKQFIYIILTYSFLCLVLYNFNPVYPLYFFLLTAIGVMVFFIYGIFKFLSDLLE